MLVDHARVVPHHEPVEGNHHDPGENKNQRRQVEQGPEGRLEDVRQKRAEVQFLAALRAESGPPADPGQRADERVGRGRGQAERPGQHAPDGADEQRGEDAAQAGLALGGAHPGGRVFAQQQEGAHDAEDVEERRQVEGRALAEGASAHGHGDRVGGVVHAGHVDGRAERAEGEGNQEH